MCHGNITRIHYVRPHCGTSNSYAASLFTSLKLICLYVIVMHARPLLYIVRLVCALNVQLKPVVNYVGSHLVKNDNFNSAFKFT